MYSGPHMVLTLFRARKVIMKDVIQVSAYSSKQMPDLLCWLGALVI